VCVVQARVLLIKTQRLLVEFASLFPWLALKKNQQKSIPAITWLRVNTLLP
jgi:hypothetical protein